MKKHGLMFIVMGLLTSEIWGSTIGLASLAEKYLKLETFDYSDVEASLPDTSRERQEKPSDSQLLDKSQKELKAFAIKLNSFVTEKKFDVLGFEKVILPYTWELMVLNSTLFIVEKPKSYPELLLRMFSRQFRTMVNASERYKRWRKSGLLGDKMVYDMVEYKVIAQSLDSVFFVSLRDTMKFEATILRHNCRFGAAVDKYRNLLTSTKIHNEPLFWVSVARARKAIDSLKRLLGGRSPWGICSYKISQMIAAGSKNGE